MIACKHFCLSEMWLSFLLDKVMLHVQMYGYVCTGVFRYVSGLEKGPTSRKAPKFDNFLPIIT